VFDADALRGVVEVDRVARAHVDRAHAERRISRAWMRSKSMSRSSVAFSGAVS
jgi:hypothetical protein